MSDKHKDKPNDSTDSNGGDVNAIEAAEFGGREPGPVIGGLLFVTALLWSLFQLWIASPLPFWFDFFIVAETQARSIHLAFAVFLAFLAFPAIMPGVRGGRWAGFFYLALATLIGVIAILSLARDGEFGVIYLVLAATLAFIAWPILKATEVTRIPVPDWLFALVAAACSSYLYFFHAELSQRPGDP
ncbi:MAG TPA: C4-dicarboxylate ABC transporter, partial [Thioalkalivibrio sp.]|nr:C4-dicarboxylate ABC transporter [Thioalkalivibrio sp.]